MIKLFLQDISKHAAWKKFLCVFVIALLCFPYGINAQRKASQKADKLFHRLAYAKALALYEKQAKKNQKSPYLNKQIATCYFHLNKPKSAVSYYAKIVKDSNVNPVDIYRYSWALKGIQEYDSAFKYMRNFYRMASEDSRAIEHITHKKSFDVLKEKTAKFDVQPTSLNSPYAEYAPVYIGTDSSYKIAFVAATPSKNKFVKRRHSWDLNAFHNLYQAEIGVNDQLTNIKVLSETLNTTFHEGPMAFTPDGKRLFFTRNNTNDEGNLETDANEITRLKLYLSTQNKEEEWDKAKELPFNSNDYSTGYPSISPDGLTLIFASQMPGGEGGYDLWKTSLENGSWTAPINLGKEVNSEGDELYPFIASDGSLFFASNGHLGLGGLDLFSAHPKGNKYNAVSNLGGSINSSYDDFGLIVNSEGKQGYFSSNRNNKAHNDDIYRFTVEGSLIQKWEIKGIVKDPKTGLALKKAIVEITDEQGTVLHIDTTNENGAYTHTFAPKGLYTITARKKGYKEQSINIDKTTFAEQNQVVKDLNLTAQGVLLHGNISDRKTKSNIEFARMELIENDGGASLYEHVTDNTGKFSFQSDQGIGESLDLFVSVSADGYLAKSQVFKQKIISLEPIDLSQKLDLALTKIEIGVEIGEAINLKPIYFDVNKATIRTDAAVELKKIIKILQENPSMEIELGSHTDCRGSDASNLNLSVRRANSSAAYIQQRIKNPNRVYGKGYGEKQPVTNCNCSDCSTSEHQLNRRTSFKIVKL